MPVLGDKAVGARDPQEEAAYLSDRIILLSPQPGTVSQILQPSVERGGRSPDEIRRDKQYLDILDEIWQILATSRRRASD